ncbi:hypothetical protein IDAT_03065 [Pseudidiomarina atlantica]|uniref:Nucleotidyl transferase AbiEii/AbiGii toxin family protein n=1 Tax=Pseudidiomarina atlantica TaxID=1517416 RepID=A0A094IQH1_9GAMM|nr:nucleotidyl transferase AbiEii/AbiGii toxin family protein [Pseudidiomarina atlantica]KFZ29357.1 hypothetical protein IDAT_03065 [Pseudidiomarina atlantica]
MLNHYLQQIVAANPDLAAITPVIEKEILHHDIMAVLVQQGVMSALTFIGGTALRMCYNSSRLSEDLDFNGGHNFKVAMKLVTIFIKKCVGSFLQQFKRGLWITPTTGTTSKPKLID